MLIIKSPAGEEFSDSQEDLRKVWATFSSDTSERFFEIVFSDGRYELSGRDNYDNGYEFDLLAAGFTVSLTDSIPATNVRAFLEEVRKYRGTNDTIFIQHDTFVKLAEYRFPNLNENKKD